MLAEAVIGVHVDTVKSASLLADILAYQHSDAVVSVTIGKHDGGRVGYRDALASNVEE